LCEAAAATREKKVLLACGGSIARTSSARSGRTNMAANWQRRNAARGKAPAAESRSLNRRAAISGP